MNKTTEALKLVELVEASVKELMGEDGMVAVIPLDLYNELIEALAAICGSRQSELTSETLFEQALSINEAIATIELALKDAVNYANWPVNKNCEDSLPSLAIIREALAEQPTVLEDPHPPHRLCECTACLEYWTPLPDCDAFAASGKPITEPVKQEEK